jgi:biopolymer transport protein ExbD
MSVRLDHGQDELTENHEINVTPFIDVMLVLLIIFMVAAPLATVDVPVDLPTSSAASQPKPAKPLFLSLKADLSVNLRETPVDRSMLKSALDAATEADTDTRIFLRADKSVAYGDLMALMDEVLKAGYAKVALVALESEPGD